MEVNQHNDNTTLKRITSSHMPAFILNKHTNERAELIGEFVDAINSGRTGRKVTPAYVNSRMAHLKLPDLKFTFEKLTKEAKSFGGLWSYYFK